MWLAIEQSSEPAIVAAYSLRFSSHRLLFTVYARVSRSQPPAVTKPSLLIQMQFPATMDAEDALPHLLQTDRLGQQWEQLISSVHDVPASRGNPWYANVVPELGAQSSHSSES